MADTPNLGLPTMADGQTQKAEVYNEAMWRLDVLAQGVAQDINETGPPSSSAEGDVHIVGVTDSNSEEWEDHDDELAVYRGGDWAFIAPKVGWSFFVISTGTSWRYGPSLGWEDVGV